MLQSIVDYQQAVKRIAPVITDADCEMFLPYLKVKQYTKGEFFVAEGQISNEIGFINSGSFRLYYLLDGKEVNANFFFEKEFVVEYQSFLLQCSSRYYIQALEDSEVITFTAAALHNAYDVSHS
jgi:CRP/FNR family transcriptional regulator, anaerobic regulatory protein